MIDEKILVWKFNRGSKDFEYKKTKDGFVLSCRGKDLDIDETFQYEFKVSK